MLRVPRLRVPRFGGRSQVRKVRARERAYAETIRALHICAHCWRDLPSCVSVDYCEHCAFIPRQLGE